MAFLCIDIGGTNTLIGLGNGDFEEKNRMKSEDFLSDIESNITKVLETTDYSKEDIEDVAVAAAGPMDREKGVFYPPNLSDSSELDEIQLESSLEIFGDLQIINDCTAAVKGEYEYGKSSENMVYITISSGIGLGAIFNGDLVSGADGNFGEVGHMKVNGDLECGCGGLGHWEAYSSGNRMLKMAEELFDKRFDSAIQLFEAYQNQDYKAELAVQKMKEVNSEALANIINLYNPDKIVFGGPVALNHYSILIEDIEEKVEEMAVNKMPEMVPAELEDQSVLYGLRTFCH